VTWEIEGTDEFAEWYVRLDDKDAAAVDFEVGLLEEHGPALGRPHADTVRGSKLFKNEGAAGPIEWTPATHLLCF